MVDKKKQKRVYKSLAEVEKEYFPNSYQKVIKTRKIQDSKNFGNKLAKEILNKAIQ